MKPPVTLVAAALSAATAGAAFQDSENEAPTPSFATSVAALMRDPIVDEAADPGAVWVRTRQMRARFDADGGTIYPVFGPRSPREWPVHFDVQSARVGGIALPVATTDSPRVEGSRVVQPRASFDEVHHLDLDGIEQTFVFQSLPASGDLVLRIGVETDLEPRAEGERLEFIHESLGRVSYGEAFLVDADGVRVGIERTWAGGSIELRVPAASLDGVVFPITIDPLWQSFSSGFGVADDANPAIAFCGASDEYLAVWEEFTSAVNSDVYATKWDVSFSTQSGGFGIDITNEAWTAPALAYSLIDDRALVAAVVDAGTSNGRVAGRLFHVAAAATVGMNFPVSSIGATQKRSVDVGGTTGGTAFNQHFIVAWSRQIGPVDHDVEYRILESDGTPLGSIRTPDSSAVNDVMPAVAKSLGDTALSGEGWHLVWIRDNDANGRGAVYGMRVDPSGFMSQNSPPFLVDATEINSSPSVSAMLDLIAPLAGGRPALVAYERHWPESSQPGGERTDIAAKVIAGDAPWQRQLITSKEGAEVALLQRAPVVTTDGRAVFIGYQEQSRFSIGAPQWDAYLAAGEIAAGAAGPEIALLERHLPMGTTADAETRLDIATRWEGECHFFPSDGACIWTRELAGAPAGFGRIEGRRFEYPLPRIALVGAVGSQYCDPLPNSAGAPFGHATSWLTIVGNGTAGSLHTATASGLPQNSFGYLLASTTTASVSHPAGSAGRLCVGGSVGRYVTQLASSGPDGVITTVVDPQNLPQPTGLATAAPGETWAFQLWHRDSVGGVATSNFTLGCAVRFAN